MRRARVVPALAFLFACSEAPSELLGDAGEPDAGQLAPDSGAPTDSGAAPDSGPPDSGGPGDTGVEDAGPAGCTTAPDCASCAADGECCWFSLNCQPGSICNTPDESLYDPTKPEQVCLRVVCTSDAECDPGEQCTLEGLCRPRVCQADDECPSGELCIGGACGAPPSPTEADSCRVVTHRWVLTPGQTLPLEAVVRDASGAPLRLGAAWVSTSQEVARVSGEVVTAGTAAGEATLTASVNTGVPCAGEITMLNLGDRPPQAIRVTAQWSDDGAPVAGAPVTVVVASGAATSLMTGVDGVTRLESPDDVASVTVLAEPVIVSIVSPGTRDVVLRVPRPVWSEAGGVRGVVDISATRRADVKLGLVGPAQPQDLLEFGRRPLMGRDPFLSLIDAPELGIEDTAELPGGMLMGLANHAFTADAGRCGPVTPGTGKLGCYLFTVPRDSGAVWSTSGQLRLFQVTSLANDLASLMEGQRSAPVLAEVAWLSRGMYHGVDPQVVLPYGPRVPTDGVSDCADPLLPGYLETCRPDYATYQAHALAADHRPSLHTVVEVPDLPAVSASACADYASAVLIADLGPRGLVPLGLGAASDHQDDRDPRDCRVTGQPRPFEANSADLSDGQLALSVAPPHAGLEGHPLRLVLTASDVEGNSGEARSALVTTLAALDSGVAPTGPFPALPTATIDAMNNRVDLQLEPQAAFVRLELFQTRRRWVVYAPAGSTLTLPDEPAAQGLLQNMTDASVLSVRGADYGRTWVADDAARLDPNRTVEGFAARRVLP